MIIIDSGEMKKRKKKFDFIHPFKRLQILQRISFMAKLKLIKNLIQLIKYFLLIQERMNLFI